MKESEDWAQVSEREDQQLIALNQHRADAEREFKTAADEVRALESQTSNINYRMLRLRSEIARAIGVPESTFPFVGELIEVREDHAAWRGAIERTLRGFAFPPVMDGDGIGPPSSRSSNANPTKSNNQKESSMMNRLIEAAPVVVLTAAAIGQLPRLVQTVRVAQLQRLKDSQSSKWGKPFLLPIQRSRRYPPMPNSATKIVSLLRGGGHSARKNRYEDFKSPGWQWTGISIALWVAALSDRCWRCL